MYDVSGGKETHVVALSGGKDSTAMALRLSELNPNTQYLYFCTPTGDELPDMVDHWSDLERRLGATIIKVSNQTLAEWIDHFEALPNSRMRWCTRLLKIEPCIRFLKSLDNPVLYVGLRADEPLRQGIYSDDVTSVFPMREWGWGLREVRQYLSHQEVTVPTRTDCARCYAQRLGEWKRLWRDHPDIYQDAVDQETRIGHTFRSDSRDTWPADLASLRDAFIHGRTTPADPDQGRLFDGEDIEGACRVCRL